MSAKLPENLRSLYEAAKKARENAYAPYSNYKVGAALRLKSGETVVGCNVENSSYPAGVCAERGAISAAVALKGKLDIAEIVIVTDSSDPGMPCGICRQTLAEFGVDMIVHATNLQGACSTHSLRELLPLAFTPAELAKGGK